MLMSSPRRRPALHVSILTPLGEGGAGGIDRVMDGLRAAVSKENAVVCTFTTTRGRALYMSPVYMALAMATLFAQRIAGTVDVVHINLSTGASTLRKIVLASLCRRLGIPYVVHLHGSNFHKFWPCLTPALRRHVDRLFQRAAGVVVLGEVWKDLITNRLPEMKGRVFIVQNASKAMPTSVGGQADEPVILFLGRVGSRKGTFDLIEALSLLPRDQRWRAIIAGDGELSRAREQIKVSGLSDRVELLGWVGPKDVDGLLCRSSMLTLPSYDENLPMSVIEGFAAGLAVVTTPVGATPDILKHEETGLLVPPGDTRALADSLSRLIEDKPLRARLGENARFYHAQHLDSAAYPGRLLAVWRAASSR